MTNPGILNFHEYQKQALRTAKNNPRDIRFTDSSMGLAGEVGELVNYLKKVVFHHHEFDKEIVAEELGDCLWYIADIATAAGLSLEKIARMNITKLKARYPEGYSDERSINRA